MQLQVTFNKALAVLIDGYVLIFTVSFMFQHSSSIHHPNLKVLNQNEILKFSRRPVLVFG